MEQWFVVNADGEPIDKIMSDSMFQLDEGFRVVKKAWPAGMYKPRHNEETDEWEEGETDEERTEREAEQNAPPPESANDKIERLQTDNARLSDLVTGQGQTMQDLLEILIDGEVI